MTALPPADNSTDALPDDRGYVRLWRKLIDSSAFQDAELLRLLIWLILRASYRRRHVAGIELMPGQVLFGRHAVAESLGTPPSTTYDRLLKLAELGCVGIKSGRTFSVVTLINWQTYQALDDDCPASNPATNRQPSGTYKKGKKEKKRDILPSSHSEAFEKFWLIYPSRKGRKAGKDRTIAEFSKIETGELAQVILAAEHYAAEVDDDYARDPERFLKANFWRDWIKPSSKNPDANRTQNHRTGNSPARVRSGEYDDPRLNGHASALASA